MLGKGDWEYSIPFFGHRSPMLSDLIFQDDATLLENHYTIIEKEKGDHHCLDKSDTGGRASDRFMDAIHCTVRQ